MTRFSALLKQSAGYYTLIMMLVVMVVSCAVWILTPTLTNLATPTRPPTGTLTTTWILNGGSGTEIVTTSVAVQQGRYYYVATNGDDSNPGTKAQPFKTIQKAADIVEPGDTVIVGDGIYTGGHIIIDLNRGGTSDSWVVFRSENKWGAVIDGRNNTSRYGWNFGSNANYVRIEGFEIKGTADDAINSNAQGSHIYVYGNHIHHIGRLCTSTSGGLSAVAVGSQARYHTFDSNVFHDVGRFADGENGCQSENDYYQNHDHGIYIRGNDITIINNIFYNFRAGWPIHIYNPGTQKNNINIINNTFAFPNPWQDGHVLITDKTSNVLIQNNIFYQPRGGAIRASGDITNITITNNISTNALVIGRSSGFTIADNLINADPSLVDPDDYDFHLQSDSPAIDAGAELGQVTHDFDGNQRPQGTAFDIGAYESPFSTQVTDLRVVAAIVDGPSLTLTLRWTAPASAVTYTLRSNNTRLTTTNWSDASIVTVPFTASEPGSSEWLTTPVDYTGGTLYLALKHQNAEGAWSALSNNAFWPHSDIYLPLIMKSHYRKVLN